MGMFGTSTPLSSAIQRDKSRIWSAFGSNGTVVAGTHNRGGLKGSRAPSASIWGRPRASHAAASIRQRPCRITVAAHLRVGRVGRPIRQISSNGWRHSLRHPLRLQVIPPGAASSTSPSQPSPVGAGCARIEHRCGSLMTCPMTRRTRTHGLSRHLAR